MPRPRQNAPDDTSFGGLEVRVLLAFYTDDASRAPAKYAEYWYWFDSPAKLLQQVRLS